MDKPNIAVVTGASSGIGATYADRLAAQGYDLLLVARRADRLKDLADRLTDQHRIKVETLVADLVKPGDCHTLEQRLEERPVAMLINNAGVGALGPTAGSTADDQERLIQLNVVALARLSLAALTGFRKTGSGTLVNISSVIALAPSPAVASYSGSKAFVLNFTRSLALEYQDSGIRVQAVMPGPIRTEFFAAQGMSDSIFPDHVYLTAGQLVDAALAGLTAGEVVTVPSLSSMATWDRLEQDRQQFLAEVMSGTVAERYLALAD